MKNIEMFFVLAMVLFFCFLYFFLSLDSNFGIAQTINLFVTIGLTAAIGALIIRRVTRKRPDPSVNKRNLTYLDLGLDSDSDESKSDDGQNATTRELSKNDESTSAADKRK